VAGNHLHGSGVHTKMTAMRSVLAVLACGVALAACGHSRGAGGEDIDPDLQPLEPAQREPVAIIEPDERIGPPDAPGAELVGAPPVQAKGPTQHVEMEGEAATAPAVAAQPARRKSGSFMTGIRYAPNK
jgi:predicted small secreted protein